jgi:hypothetical protein
LSNDGRRSRRAFARLVMHDRVECGLHGECSRQLRCHVRPLQWGTTFSSCIREVDVNESAPYSPSATDGVCGNTHTVRRHASAAASASAIWRCTRQAGRCRAEGSHLNAVVREMIAKVSHECRWRTRRPPPVAAGCSAMKPALARDGGPLQRAVEWAHVSRPVVPGQPATWHDCSATCRPLRHRVSRSGQRERPPAGFRPADRSHGQTRPLLLPLVRIGFS